MARRTLYLRFFAFCRSIKLQCKPADTACCAWCFPSWDLRLSIMTAAFFQTIAGLGFGITAIIIFTDIVYRDSNAGLSVRDNAQSATGIVYGLVVYSCVRWLLDFATGVVGLGITISQQGIKTYSPRVLHLSRVYLLGCWVLFFACINFFAWNTPAYATETITTLGAAGFLAAPFDAYIVYLAWSFQRKLHDQQKGVFEGRPVLRSQRKPDHLLHLEHVGALQLYENRSAGAPPGLATAAAGEAAPSGPPPTAVLLEPPSSQVIPGAMTATGRRSATAGGSLGRAPSMSTSMAPPAPNASSPQLSAGVDDGVAEHMVIVHYKTQHGLVLPWKRREVVISPGLRRPGHASRNVAAGAIAGEDPTIPAGPPASGPDASVIDLPRFRLVRATERRGADSDVEAGAEGSRSEELHGGCGAVIDDEAGGGVWQGAVVHCGVMRRDSTASSVATADPSALSPNQSHAPSGPSTSARSMVVVKTPRGGTTHHPASHSLFLPESSSGRAGMRLMRGLSQAVRARVRGTGGMSAPAALPNATAGGVEGWLQAAMEAGALGAHDGATPGAGSVAGGGLNTRNNSLDIRQTGSQAVQPPQQQSHQHLRLQLPQEQLESSASPVMFRLTQRDHLDQAQLTPQQQQSSTRHRHDDSRRHDSQGTPPASGQRVHYGGTPATPQLVPRFDRASHGSAAARFDRVSRGTSSRSLNAAVPVKVAHAAEGGATASPPGPALGRTPSMYAPSLQPPSESVAASGGQLGAGRSWAAWGSSWVGWIRVKVGLSAPGAQLQDGADEAAAVKVEEASTPGVVSPPALPVPRLTTLSAPAAGAPRPPQHVTAPLTPDIPTTFQPPAGLLSSPRSAQRGEDDASSPLGSLRAVRMNLFSDAEAHAAWGSGSDNAPTSMHATDGMSLPSAQAPLTTRHSGGGHASEGGLRRGSADEDNRASRRSLRRVRTTIGIADHAHEAPEPDLPAVDPQPLGLARPGSGPARPRSRMNRVVMGSGGLGPGPGKGNEDDEDDPSASPLPGLANSLPRRGSSVVQVALGWLGSRALYIADRGGRSKPSRTGRRATTPGTAAAAAPATAAHGSRPRHLRPPSRHRSSQDVTKEVPISPFSLLSMSRLASTYSEEPDAMLPMATLRPSSLSGVRSAVRGGADSPPGSPTRGHGAMQLQKSSPRRSMHISPIATPAGASPSHELAAAVPEVPWGCEFELRGCGAPLPTSPSPGGLEFVPVSATDRAAAAPANTLDAQPPRRPSADAAHGAGMPQLQHGPDLTAGPSGPAATSSLTHATTGASNSTGQAAGDSRRGSLGIIGRTGSTTLLAPARMESMASMAPTASGVRHSAGGGAGSDAHQHGHLTHYGSAASSMGLGGNAMAPQLQLRRARLAARESGAVSTQEALSRVLARMQAEDARAAGQPIAAVPSSPAPRSGGHGSDLSRQPSVGGLPTTSPEWDAAAGASSPRHGMGASAPRGARSGGGTLTAAPVGQGMPTSLSATALSQLEGGGQGADGAKARQVVAQTSGGARGVGRRTQPGATSPHLQRRTRGVAADAPGLSAGQRGHRDHTGVPGGTKATGEGAAALGWPRSDDAPPAMPHHRYHQHAHLRGWAAPQRLASVPASPRTSGTGQTSTAVRDGAPLGRTSLSGSVKSGVALLSNALGSLSRRERAPATDGT